VNNSLDGGLAKTADAIDPAFIEIALPRPRFDRLELICRRLLDAIDHDRLHRAFARLEFQSQRLHRRKNRRDEIGLLP
jgi:hypothetical protein